MGFKIVAGMLLQPHCTADHVSIGPHAGCGGGGSCGDCGGGEGVSAVSAKQAAAKVSRKKDL